MLLRCIICAACLIGFNGKIKAQQEISTAFADQMAIIFGSLETNRVPYGLLFDIALEQAQLVNYKGNILADSNYVDMAELHAIYQTLRSMRFHSTSATFSSADVLDSLAMLQRQPGRILLSGLFFKYSKVREDALIANLITQTGNTLLDKYIGGVWQNPYQTETAFALAPVNPKLQGLSQQILLPTNLWFGNDFGAISSIQIDAGDGLGYRTLSPGTALNVNYLDTGYKTLSYKVNLVLGGSLYTHSKIYIAADPEAAYEPNDMLMRGFGSNPAHGVTVPITATDAFGGQYAEGYVTILYANESLGLRNPVIVAEGFDPGHITNPELKRGENDIWSFRNEVIGSQSNALSTILLDSPQYDIVYVDWKRGTDNIKRNAQLLKEVIRQVNLLKSNAGSTAKNIVIGQSMGGLVARWALKEMENNSEDHETNLFVSYDTPHQGANVPLGYQHLARHAYNLYIKTGITAAIIELVQFIGGGARPSKVLRLADTDAARQMLISYVNNNNQVDNSVHNTWQGELQTMGYPQGISGSPLRLVAVSNASECATLQDAGPNALVLNYEGKGSTRFLGDVVSAVAFPLAAYLTGQFAFYLGVLPGKTEINFDVKINLTSYGGGNRVYYNKITITKKILWLIPVTSTITNQSFNAPVNQLPYDSYPGGIFSTGMSLSSSHDQNWFFKYNITASHIPTFNFVPVTSSLDIGSGAVALTGADYTTKYIGAAPPVGTKASPFANFITAFNHNITANEGHLNIHQRNGNWLAAEMQQASAGTTTYPTAPNCTFVCSTSRPVVTGPVVLGSTNTYTLANLPPGATVRWEVSSPYTIVGSTTANPVGVAYPSSPASQFSQLVAFVITACGETPFTKTLVPPTLTTTLATIQGDPCGTGVASINVPSGANFVWLADGDISIEGLAPGQPYYTTSNTVNMVGVSGNIMVSFQSYGNTVTASHYYEPYLRTISVAANPMIGSDPLSAMIVGIDFSYIDIKWYLNDVYISNPWASPEMFFDTNSPPCGSHSLSAKAELDCGATVTIGRVDIERYCRGWWSAMVVYPNPASSYMVIAPNTEKQKGLSSVEKSKMKEFEASLYDVKGKLLLKGRSNNFKLQLDTRKLKTDYYYLHIRMDGDKDVLKQQVIIRN
jgi:Secretion system C-terminal sorting domain/PGAP1-like protein